MQGASARKIVFDPRPILGVLARHQVRFVVIGGIAASLQGSTTITNDFDICYARDQENLGRLAAALTEAGATLRGVREPVAFRLDARTLKAGLNSPSTRSTDRSIASERHPEASTTNSSGRMPTRWTSSVRTFRSLRSMT